jgi:hypothetical protein
MTVNRDLIELQQHGVIVHSNLGKKDTDVGDIDPSTIDDLPEDEKLIDLYFVSGYTYPQPYTTTQGTHRTYKVLAYLIFDDSAPMAQRREAVQAVIDLCRMFYSNHH